MPGFSFAGLFGAIYERFYLVVITASGKLAKDWLVSKQWIKDKEKQYLETELNFLKSQIQPHFFSIHLIIYIL
ncbi:hypothetical protein ACFQ3S_12960 [Mucilaginibacter terrae]|uniref:hypothetical protein n=1 Tax=Mucilaginibacter terrae TaxID=1955052 RepID=UPI003632DC4A